MVRLTLKPFEGDPINFLTFCDNFKAVVHDDDNLDNVVEFT